MIGNAAEANAIPKLLGDTGKSAISDEVGSTMGKVQYPIMWRLL